MTEFRLKRLGLLGGMGPSATLDVLQKIVELTDANTDQQHLPIIVWNLPQIPDRTASLVGGGASPAPLLAAGARGLREAGADYISIACNTAHHWYDVIRAASCLPVIHIADTAIEALAGVEVRRGQVAIMATAGTIASGFYQSRLLRAGYIPLLPHRSVQDEAVSGAIAHAKAGRWPEAVRAVSHGVEHVVARGADAVLLACTELPLLVRGLQPHVPMIDANRALAHACIRHAGARQRADPVMAQDPTGR